VRIHFHATLRDVVGGRDPDLPVAQGTRVGALLDTIVTRWPEARAKLFDADGVLYRNVHVMVNGRDARWLPDGLDTALREDDALDVFPAVGGG
jgi:molybdopterin synthase sulfur carrier subunit